MSSFAHRALCVVSFGALCVTSCRYPATSVLFVLGSDAPPERSLRLEARVWRVGEPEPSAGSTLSSMNLTEDGEAMFSVVPRGEPRSQAVQVRLEATLASTPTQPTQVLRRTLRFAFTPNVTLYQRVFFAMACLNPSTDCRNSTSGCTVQDACEERGQTCGDNGACVPIDVAPEMIPDGGLPRDVFSRDATLDVSPEDSAVDARTDASQEDIVSDTGIDAGVDTGLDSGVDTGADVRSDSGIDTGVDARPDVGVDTGV